MNKIISVIVPIYNVEQYLIRAVDSILNQSYKNLEIILVDDGSPDRCGEICDMYARKDNRVKVIHKNNGGLSSARNSGLEVANGDYIVFVDSDDYIQPHMIERLLSVAYGENCDIVQCNFFRFSDDNIPKEYLSSEYKIISKYYALDKIDNASFMAAWNKLYKKELFNNIRFPAGKIHEDVGCTYKLFYYCNKISIIQDELYGYYVNSDSITTSKIKINKLDLIDIYAEQMEFFKAKGLKSCFYRSANNLAACFGTLLSYAPERYEDYNVFLQKLQDRFIVIRRKLLKNRLRIDLYLSILLSFGNVKFMKIYHKVKSIKTRRYVQ